MPMRSLYCYRCRGWWQDVLHIKSKSRSKSRKRSAEEESKSSNSKSQTRDEVLSLTPFSSRRGSSKDSPGAPWIKSTPASRLPALQKEGEREDLPLPPQPELPLPPQPPAIAAEVKAKIEELKKSLGSAYTKDLEAKILEAANASTQMAKAALTHGDLNKFAQAKKQYIKAVDVVKEIDKDWASFAQTLQAAFDREQAAYKEQRAQAIEDLRAKKSKLQEQQDAIRRSALSHIQEEEEEEPTPQVEDGYTFPPVENAEQISDEELMDDSAFQHAPKAFARLGSLPDKRSEAQEGKPSKKIKSTLPEEAKEVKGA